MPIPFAAPSQPKKRIGPTGRSRLPAPHSNTCSAEDRFPSLSANITCAASLPWLKQVLLAERDLDLLIRIPRTGPGPITCPPGLQHKLGVRPTASCSPCTGRLKPIRNIHVAALMSEALSPTAGLTPICRTVASSNRERQTIAHLRGRLLNLVSSQVPRSAPALTRLPPRYRKTNRVPRRKLLIKPFLCYHIKVNRPATLNYIFGRQPG